MRIKRSIQLRRCKVCGKTGHNSARCVTNFENLKVQKNAKLSIKNKLLKTTKLGTAAELAMKKSAQIVLVKHQPVVRQSPHVVDLKNKQEKSENIWHKVRGFTERPLVKEERRVVDFGALVKAHRIGNEVIIEKQKHKNTKTQKHKFEDKVKNLKIVRLKDRNKFERLFETRNLKLTTYTKSLFKKFINGPMLYKQKLAINLKTFFKFKFQVSSFRFQVNYRKLAYVSIILFIIASLPFPALSYYNDVKDTSTRVVVESTNAFTSLQSSMKAVLQTDLGQAQEDLNSALQSFGVADNILENEHHVLLYLASLLPIIGKQVTGRQNLLLAGHQLALGNAYLLKGVQRVEGDNSLALTDRLTVLTNHLQAAIPAYDQALTELAKIDQNILPEQYQKTFTDFKLLYATFIGDLNNLVELSRSLNLVFGGQELKRYLLVFQNNSELRPTGGFVGSFAIMDVQKGKIMKLDIPGGGAYDLQGQLDEYLKPPLPLQLVNSRWEFQDANWFPDFSKSAEKLAWFYQHSRGATVDGVIAINASVLERLLKVFGSVKSENYNLEINSDNALAKIQQQVEVDYDKSLNQPKAVLGDLSTQFFEKFKKIDATSAVFLLSELQTALTQKEIQVFFADKQLQKHFQDFGWTGEITPGLVNQDYLLVVNANLNGQKSDAKIQQQIEHQAVIQADGTVVDTVIIERTHNGLPGEAFYGANNVSYIRIYVPEGAELLSAGGFSFPPEDAFHVPEAWYKNDADLAQLEQEVTIDKQTGTHITKEFNKTAFGNWTMVAPGQTTKVYFTYRLPFKLLVNQSEYNNQDSLLAEVWRPLSKFLVGKNREVSKYSLAVQKQSGSNSNFSTRIIYPEGWTPLWQANEKMNLAVNGGEYGGELLDDELFGLVMEKK